MHYKEHVYQQGTCSEPKHILTGCMPGLCHYLECSSQQHYMWELQGEMAALFLRHEGFLGAMGAFLKVHPMAPSFHAAWSGHASHSKEPRKVSTPLFVLPPYVGGTT